MLADLVEHYGSLSIVGNSHLKLVVQRKHMGSTDIYRLGAPRTVLKQLFEAYLYIYRNINKLKFRLGDLGKNVTKLNKHLIFCVFLSLDPKNKQNKTKQRVLKNLIQDL